ncbi:MAG: flavodoxin family protein, partial [Firmicutes bacterium]|nr:flavodoxin family protein [Bacillota bacterium]
MKLLIHDLSPAEWEKISDNYQDWTVVSDTGAIRPCIGCFRCWTDGSGDCAFQDGYERMGALIHEADELTVMSRYTYGGFSS